MISEVKTNELKNGDMAEDYLRKLLDYLGKTDVDDEPVSILVILEVFGIEIALYILDVINAQYDDDMLNYSAWCIRQIPNWNSIHFKFSGPAYCAVMLEESMYLAARVAWVAEATGQSEPLRQKQKERLIKLINDGCWRED
jgi:hypothetical protein